MNTAIQAALDHAVQTLQQEGVLPSDWNNSSNLTRTKDRSHGDFASNIAMIGSKAAGMKPRDLAEKILAALPKLQTSAKLKSQVLVLSISF
ncbi:arginyl tRNA synthetase N terminal domain protein [Acinetobacter baumannii 1546444]|nr:arginyl tRNA synthetase N terminal domain protein [Acinetobacter baumannii 1546444]